MRKMLSMHPHLTEQEKGNVIGWIWAWIDRLRDPESKQARGKLKDKHGMCCLGHLCDLAAISGYGIWDVNNAFLVIQPVAAHDILRKSFTPMLLDCEWEGKMSHGKSLYARNDRGASLQEIADVIENECHKIKWPFPY
jgi:hypothetical protein